jgi:hypothetical protein
MNSSPHDPMASGTTSDSISASVFTPAEETLRLIANLPAPDGLEDRVHAALNAMPRRSRVVAWPRALRAESGWMRSAAAAAIVFVVAGGGWGVYTRVESTQMEQNQPAKVIVMPTRMPSTGGLSGAGAMRPPLTLPGPAAPQPVKISREASPARAKAGKKPVASRKATSHSGHSAATGAPMAEPAASR